MKKRIFALLAIGALAFTPAKKADLIFKLAKGKTYVHTSEISSKIKQTAMGQVQEQEATITATTYFEFAEEGTGADMYTMWYDNIGMDISLMGQKQRYTSDTTNLEMVDPMSSLFAGLTKSKFQARITRKGLVEEVMGLEEHIAELTGRDSGSPNQMSEVISSSFGDDGLARNVEISTNIFPESTVKPGDTWTLDQPSNSGLPVKLKNKYTLVSLNDTHAEIELTGLFTVDPANERMEQMGMEMLYFLEGDRKGNLTVEIATGWVTAATITDNITGSVTISPNDQLPDGMTMPLEAEIITRITGK
jgi:hypothetical protein